ncbi:GNAT family N-acetyltransferase [Catalinimonas niigatensis]|uniref:GNAT family N-acetyltransferase n=1 Tax=Catalinimonas niigatensis TaxID=1397264 RepID=UPI0026650436|nr:GNAT family N-acetyltransferase [Catalinimonas niigatensis]WPP48027.1 GNAT family N-acetyltransferase [Catalinimonas niigatensis]
MNIILFQPQHWPSVAEIYHLGLLTRNATFETEVPAFEVWDQKFYSHLRWVAQYNQQVVGWAGLMPVSARKAYVGVAEVSIYIHPDSAGHGIGKRLMQHLITKSEQAGIWTLQASIFPENAASILLHESSGFRKVGFREKIAQLEGVWRDTLIYERRSTIAGI